jgi:lysyl-tRNA synthetase class 1
MPIVTPAEVEAVIRDADQSDAPIDLMAIGTKLSAARQALAARSAPTDEDQGAWVELMAIYLQMSFSNVREDPWNSFFRPLSSMTSPDGIAYYTPDVVNATEEAVAHWAGRARNLTHPVLRARYADVVWELGCLITKKRRDVAMARIALDAYIDAVDRRLVKHTTVAFKHAKRAIDLAAQIGDRTGVDRARQALLGLHREVMARDAGRLWATAYDHLVDHQKAGTSPAEMDSLVADMERVLARASDSGDPKRFDPHAVADVVTRLTKHYSSRNLPQEARRVQATKARALEFAAGLGKGMLAASLQQDSLDAYRQAGMPDEAERVRLLMQRSLLETKAEMHEFSVPVTIPKAQMDAMVNSQVVDDLGQTFANIAEFFVPEVSRLEAAVTNIAKEAPLFSMMSHQIIADDRVAAHVGSVEDDQGGRVLQQALQEMQISVVVLHRTLQVARERHNFTADQIVAWANRHGLIDVAKVALLRAGVQAWLDGDHVKALHVIIPRIESALRRMVEVIGKPITKAAGTVAGVSVAINMGDILFNPATVAALGSWGADMANYFKVVYADPRGMNLRNEFAHGLLDEVAIHEGTTAWLIHTLLVIGLWSKPEPV